MPSTNVRPIAAGPAEGRSIATGADAIVTAQRVWRHARTEFQSDIEAILATVNLAGPLLYVLPAGPLGPPVLGTTPAAVEAHYTALYAAERIIDWQTRFEVRSPWYTFFEGEVTRQMADEPPDSGQVVVLFPMGEGEQILGEMPWARSPKLGIGEAGKASPVWPGKPSRDLFNRYLAALRSNDPEAAAAAFAPGAVVATRDYRAGEGLTSADARDFYRELAEQWSVTAVDFVNLMAEEWYVFAELQWTVRDRASGAMMRLNTVDFFPLVAGAFAARVGYGTAMVPA